MTSQTRLTFHLPLPAFALATLALLTMTATTPALAQTFSVLYALTGGAEGQSPNGVTIGGPGLFYGTTFEGGTHGWGTAFKLTQRGSGWTLSPLYEFTGGSDGGLPLAGVTVGPNGAVYGTTFQGGSSNEGTVFELQPPAAACKTAVCYWNETVLHSFTGDANDGGEPQNGDLIFDQAGNIYGTTLGGGTGGAGTVFELSPSGGGWTLSLLHSFYDNGTDGWYPRFGLIFDSAGNLYSSTEYGGTAEGGTVFELSPSGGTWTEDILHNFPLDGAGYPANPGALVMDRSGNLYGSNATSDYSSNSTVFELTPSDGSWIFSTLYTFARYDCYPQPVAMDAAGHIYGLCNSGGLYGWGWVFKLTNSNGSWTLTHLYDFTGQSDGGNPSGPVVLDSSGNLYGATTTRGNLSDCIGYETAGCGTIWEITP